MTDPVTFSNLLDQVIKIGAIEASPAGRLSSVPHGAK
jgi:hypothetical protein